MAITYEVDASLGVVFARWTGVITAQDVSTYMTVLMNDEKARACGRSLADIREAEFRTAGAALSDLVRTAVQPVLTGWTAAILTSSPAAYGLARQFQALTEGFMRTAVFTDEASAREWIIPAR
ncbi:MAG TPA: hypothetical protein VMF70_13060 [Gemmatimonadales bacterium]|nr:hypothetical protein [Gemmatimonadales bacterium]